MNRTGTLICAALLLASSALAQDELDGELKPPPNRRRPSMFHKPRMDSPVEQLACAEALAADGKTGKAMKQYRALVHEWHNTPEAAKAQEAYARLHADKGNYPRAFDEFQYLIDNFDGQFAYANVIDEQFKIAHQVMTKRRAQWLGMPGFTSPGLALPFFEKVVANAPVGKRAAEARFYTGVIHEQAGDYEAAAAAFRAAYSRHPDSVFAMDARFRYAHCTYKISGSAPKAVVGAGATANCGSASSANTASAVRRFMTGLHVPFRRPDLYHCGGAKRQATLLKTLSILRERPILEMPPETTAMVINGHRNKPFGPGGSTRHLHHIPPNRTWAASDGGETGSTRV